MQRGIEVVGVALSVLSEAKLQQKLDQQSLQNPLILAYINKEVLYFQKVPQTSINKSPSLEILITRKM